MNTKLKTNYTNEPTDDPHLFRVVDRNGDWTYYYQDELNQYIPAVNHVLHVGFPKGMGLITWLKRTSEEEANRVLTNAGERGARIHAAIRSLIDGQVLSIDATYPDEQGNKASLNYEEWDCLITWCDWANNFNPKVLKHETSLWNKKHLYAGTTDFIGSIELKAGTKIYIDDKLTTIGTTRRISALLDWKTGGTYDDHKLQIAAYAGCLKTKPQGEFFTGIVRLGTRHQNGGYEIKLWSRGRTKYHFERFIAAKDQFNFITGKDWQPQIKHIPLTLSIKIPQMGQRKRNATTLNKGVPKSQKQRRATSKN